MTLQSLVPRIIYTHTYTAKYNIRQNHMLSYSSSLLEVPLSAQ